jgi:hypothetical protein
LIAGRGSVARLAREKDLPALWVDDRGRLDATERIREHIIWTAHHDD